MAERTGSPSRPPARPRPTSSSRSPGTFAPERSWTYESTLQLVKKRRRLAGPVAARPRAPASSPPGTAWRCATRPGSPRWSTGTARRCSPGPRTGRRQPDPAVAPRAAARHGPVRGRTGAPRRAGTSPWSTAPARSSGRCTARRPQPLTSTLSRPVQQAAQAAVDAQQLPDDDGGHPAVDRRPARRRAERRRRRRARRAERPVPARLDVQDRHGDGAPRGGRRRRRHRLPCPGSATVGQRTVATRTSRSATCRCARRSPSPATPRSPAAATCRRTRSPRRRPARPRRRLRDPRHRHRGRHVPTAASTTEQVENSIGQGTVQASCFGMALMSATVAAGRAVTPEAVARPRRPWSTPATRRRPRVVGSLRTMMRAVVTSGRGKASPGTATSTARPAPRRSATAPRTAGSPATAATSRSRPWCWTARLVGRGRRHRFVPTAPSERTHAVDLAEGPGEVAGVREAHPAADLADRQVGRGEQAPGLDHAALGDPLLHGAAGLPADGRGEVARGDAHRGGHVPQRQRLGVAALDDVEHLGQQRFAVLAQVARPRRRPAGTRRPAAASGGRARPPGSRRGARSARRAKARTARGPAGPVGRGTRRPQRADRAAADEREQQRVGAPGQVRAGNVRAERVGGEEHAPPVGAGQIGGVDAGP